MTRKTQNDKRRSDQNDEKDTESREKGQQESWVFILRWSQGEAHYLSDVCMVSDMGGFAWVHHIPTRRTGLLAKG